MGKSKDENDRLLDGTLPADPAADAKAFAPDATARKTTLRLVDEGVAASDLPLPSDVHAEGAILAALLWAGTNAPSTLGVAHIRDLLDDPAAFFTPAHRDIYGAIATVSMANESPSVTAVHSELIKRRAEKSSGGMDYLEALVAAAVPTSEQALRHHASNVRGAWILRRLITMAKKVEGTAKQRNVAAEGVIEATHAELIALSSSLTTSPKYISFSQGATDVLRNATTGSTGALPTGLTALDDVMGGFFPLEVTIIAARTSVGKSALATQFAFDTIEKRPTEAVLYASLEMPARSFIARILSGRARVNLKRIRRQTVSLDDLQKLEAAARAMKESRVYFVDSQIQTIMSISAMAKRLASTLAREGIRLALIVVDHIGIVKPSSEAAKKQREQQVADTSRGLKYLAQEHRCHVMGLAQIGREAEKQDKDKMPQLHHLRESGSIEQDADNILILHRDRDRYGRFIPNKPARLAVAKARNDALGLVWLAMEPEIGRFVPWETSDQAKVRVPEPTHATMPEPEPDDDDGSNTLIGDP